MKLNPDEWTLVWSVHGPCSVRTRCGLERRGKGVVHLGRSRASAPLVVRLPYEDYETRANQSAEGVPNAHQGLEAG